MRECEPKPVAGRLPPQSLDAEAAVLSAMLCSAEACDEALDVVRAEDFYSDANRTVARAIVDLHGQGQPVDPVVVAEWLRSRELIQRIGGAVYLAQLVDATPAVANVRAHAQIVRELRHVRSWVSTAQRWAAQGYDAAAQADPAGYIQAAALEYQRVLDDTAGADVRPLREWLKVVVDRSTELSNNHEQLAGVDTGLEALNERTGGHHEGDLTVLAARPGMGKSAMATGFALAAAAEGDVYLWSGEMPCEQIVARMISQESGVDLRRLRQGRLEPLEWNRVTGAAEQLSALNIWVDDRPAVSALEFRTRARRVQLRARQYGRKLALSIADYMQLMAGDGRNREQEISHISRGLKGAAKALHVPVVALSQLNRDVENREDKTPRLADLRESGAIEQDADVVLFLYRPGYYQEQKGKADETQGRTQLTIAKQRNGPTGSAPLKWWGGCAKFGRWEY